MDIKRLLELAGVDTSQGKAKALMESQLQQWKYVVVDNYTDELAVSAKVAWDGVNLVDGLRKVAAVLVQQEVIDEDEDDNFVARTAEVLHPYGSSRSDRDNPAFDGITSGYVYSDEHSIMFVPA